MPQSSVFFDKIQETYDGKFIVIDVNGEKHIKIWSRTFPDGRMFKFWTVASNKFLLRDNDGRSWIYYPIYKEHKLLRKRFWRLPCSIFCGVNRLHLTCLWCVYRRILAGKHPNPTKCRLLLDIVESGRQLSFLRIWLIKNLTSVKEAIAHW